MHNIINKNTQVQVQQHVQNIPTTFIQNHGHQLEFMYTNAPIVSKSCTETINIMYRNHLTIVCTENTNIQIGLCSPLPPLFLWPRYGVRLEY